MITASITVEQLDTSRIRLNARTAGAGELVLLLHGITAGAIVWDPVIACRATKRVELVETSRACRGFPAGRSSAS